MIINLEKDKFINLLIKYFVYFKVFCLQYQNDDYNTVKIFSDFLLGFYNTKNISIEKKRLLNNLSEKKHICHKNIFNDFESFTINTLELKVEQKKFFYKLTYNKKLEISFTKELNNKIYSKLYKLNQNKYLISFLTFLYYIFGFETGQFWGVPPSFYKMIERNYKNPQECFASPFNHTLKNYFSPLYFIDKYFNSSGNFFHDFLKIKKDIYIINPPFIESLLRKVFLMSLIKLKEKNTVLFFYLPNWKDMTYPFIDELKNKKFYRKHYVLQKNNSLVYDYIKEITIINKSFELIIIHASNVFNEKDIETFNKMYDIVLKK